MFRCFSSNPTIKNSTFPQTLSTTGRGQTLLAINLVNWSLGRKSLTPKTVNRNYIKINVNRKLQINALSGTYIYLFVKFGNERQCPLNV